MEPMPCQPAACAAAASTAQHPGQPPPALDLAEVFQARVPVVETGPPTTPRACPCTGPFGEARFCFRFYKGASVWC